MPDIPRSALLIRPSGQVETLRPAAAADDFAPYLTRGERDAASLPKNPAERRPPRRPGGARRGGRGGERLVGRLVDVEA